MKPHEFINKLESHNKWLKGEGGEQLILKGGTVNSFRNINDYSFSKVIFEMVNFVDSYFKDVCLDEARFENCYVEGTFIDCSFKNIDFYENKLKITAKNCNFSQASLVSSKFRCTSLYNCNLTKANLNFTNWDKSKAETCNFDHTTLFAANLTYLTLKDCKIDNIHKPQRCIGNGKQIITVRADVDIVVTQYQISINGTTLSFGKWSSLTNKQFNDLFPKLDWDNLFPIIQLLHKRIKP